MTPKLVLVLFVLAAAGCRSDGGIDRADCKQGMDFTLHTLAQQTRNDMAATRDRVASLPGSLSRSVTESKRSLRNTYGLYFETHEAH